MREEVTIQVRRITETAQLPKKNHDEDGAFDFYSDEEILIPAQGRATIKTGISLAFPEGYVFFFKDRSGLAAKEGLTTMAGLIDSGYRGEYMIVLSNTTDKDYQVAQGHRIAQGLLLPVPHITFNEVEELPPSSRGGKGFGSSGK